MKSLSCLTAVVATCAALSVTEAGTPRLQRLSPPGGQRGTTVEIQLNGRYLDQPQEILLYEPGITVEAVEMATEFDSGNGRMTKLDSGVRVKVRMKIAADAPLGPHGLRLRTSKGITEYQRFFVGPFPTVEEAEDNRAKNDKPEASKAVSLNSTVLGRMNDPADVDLFKFEAKQGQRITAEIEAARLGVETGLPDLHLRILDAAGKPLVTADDSAVFLQDPIASKVIPADGTYFVEVRHSLYSSASDIYRLHLGEYARPTALYPAGGMAGEDIKVQVIGDPKGEWSQSVKLPSHTTEGASVTESFNYGLAAVAPESGLSAPAPNVFRVSPFPNVLESEPNDSIDAIVSVAANQLPIAFNGIIEKPRDVDCFRFAAKKGDRYRVHCLANALGSPVDPTIWIRRVSGKANNTVLRATDSRLNQLRQSPVNGTTRDTLDPIMEFTASEDGEYVLGVENDRPEGGQDFVYRVEITAETDGVYTYIPLEPENQFTPQARQTISVPVGGRYNTQVAIINSNRPFNGDLELVAVGLPEGVTMHASKITPSMPRVSVVFEAAPGTKLQGGLIDLIVKPAGEGAQTAIVSGFRQNAAMNGVGNNDFYLPLPLAKLPLAVVDEAPFTVEVEAPKSALVQNGEMSVKFAVRRREGYDEPINVAMEWKPNGVSVGTPVTIPSGKSEGEYLLGAARNATAGSYEVTLTAVSGAQRPSYRDGADRTYVAAKPFKLNVAEPHLEARLPRASIERGKTAELTIKLTHLKPFDGKAKVTLTRLPRGVELVDAAREIGPEDKEVRFTLRATEDCLLGNYQGVTLDVTVTEDGQSVRQLTGSGTLRIDAERGVKAAVK